jgi:hypothetical protein
VKLWFFNFDDELCALENFLGRFQDLSASGLKLGIGGTYSQSSATLNKD